MGFAIPGLLSEGIICYTVLHKRGEANDLCRCDSETAAVNGGCPKLSLPKNWASAIPP